MMRVDDLVEAISALQRSDLEAWIREELVTPRQEAGTLLFTDMECARVRLICTLHYELEIDPETLPVVLSLVYYQCPMLCNQVLNGMVTAFKVMAFKPGEEFDVVTVSFDPRETPASFRDNAADTPTSCRQCATAYARIGIVAAGRCPNECRCRRWSCSRRRRRLRQL